MDTVNWGIISTADIGTEQVIPAIQEAENCNVTAISSRKTQKANQAAYELGIPNSFGSYDELLAQKNIDAVYNPLPNHLHVPITKHALEAGKHVLCEKPIAMDASEAQDLHDASRQHPQLNVMEAFMYRFHPQWKRAKSMVDSGDIGKLRTIDSFFSYYNDDPEDIRNKKEMGGGGLMDIGCYCISLSRFLFGTEPKTVEGCWYIDSQFNTDYLASGVLDFGTGTATFTCATQTAPQQRVEIVGTKGRIIIEIPFNAPPNNETHIYLYINGNKKEISFAPVNQYTLQAKTFSEAVLNNNSSPIPLSDAVKNMQAIDAFRRSAKGD